MRLASSFLSAFLPGVVLLSIQSVVWAEFPKVKLVPITEGELVAPVAIRNAGDGSDRLFIADQRGKIQIIKNGSVLGTPFLDLESELVSHGGGYDERGLLGLAFHPNYGSSGQPGEGKFYVYYSADSPNEPGTAQDPVDHRSIVAEYTVSGDPDVANEMSGRIVLTFDQPQFNHNGGDLAFGPEDGLLYISTGDGGGSNDNEAGHTGGNSGKPSGGLGNAQDRTNLLGKILRIDPLGNDGPGGEYGIPVSNPFVGEGGGVREEIFAYGLRNPWRMSFDEGTGGTNRLFVADVGQGDVEEIDMVMAGDNLGWRNREGSFVFDANAPGSGPFVDPLVEYVHPGDNIGGLPQIGVSVTGGYFYRGSRYSTMQGKYIFGDWSTSFGSPAGTLLCMEEVAPGDYSLIVLDVDGGNPIGKYITAFGTDEAGEIYVATRQQAAPVVQPGSMLPTGGIYRIEAQSTEATVMLEPAKDNTIYSDKVIDTYTENSNGSGDWLFSGLTTGNDERRTLLQFDIASALPDDAIITDVVFELTLDKTVSGSIQYDLHRLTSDWGEGSSDASDPGGKGTSPATGDATWVNAFYDSVAWSSVGGDFVAGISASAFVAGTDPMDGFTKYEWTSAQLAQDVQDWLDGIEMNYGWIVRTTDSNVANAKRFRSREHPETTTRPKLTITYQSESLPTYQPDNTIKQKGRPELGNGIYNLSGGGQSIRLKGVSTSKFKYDLGVQNDGDDTDTIRLTGSGKNKLFKVSYLLQRAGSISNISAAVSRGTSLTGFSPAEKASIRVSVKAKGKARKRNAAYRGYLLSRSLNDSSKRDLVASKILSRKKSKR